VHEKNRGIIDGCASKCVHNSFLEEAPAFLQSSSLALPPPLRYHSRYVQHLSLPLSSSVRKDCMPTQADGRGGMEPNKTTAKKSRPSQDTTGGSFSPKIESANPAQLS
jgi:hypothetical protein